MLFAPIDNSKVSQDQSLALQGKIIEYVREALIYDTGYLILEIRDLGSFDFNFYYSSGSEIEAKYDETRDETIDRILYTLSCSEFKEKCESGAKLSVIMQYLYNYIVGFISANVLCEKYGIKDHSTIFKKEESIEV